MKIEILSRHLRFGAALIALTLVTLPASCQRETSDRIRIAASTTMIEAIVKQVGRSRVEVEAIVPGGMCPGHFDISPSQMATITQADAMLYQGWENWVKVLIRSKTDIAEPKLVGIQGNWLIPDVHIKAVERIKEILVSMDPDGSTLYEANAACYADSVAKVALEITERFTSYAGTKVLCSKLQADFLAWLGFDVVGTFERQEDLTPRKLADLIALGRNQKVHLVVDNLQSGRRVGEEIARELGAEHAVISNFPLEGSYLETLKENANELESKLKPAKEKASDTA